MLDSPKKSIPEGAVVQIEVMTDDGPTADTEQVLDQGETLGKSLMRFSGTVSGLPEDLAENHDHYLHGLPKK